MITLQELNNSLQLLPASSNIVLFGDFNAPHIDWSLVSPVISTPINTQLCSIVSDNFLTQFVFVPTRQNHILDLVFQTSPIFYLVLKWWIIYLIPIIQHYILLLLYHHVTNLHVVVSCITIQRLISRYFVIPCLLCHGIPLLIMTLILITSGISGVICFYLWLTHVYLELSGRGVN